MATAAGITYTYDGDGRRVSKVGSKLYWYGSGSDILAETDVSDDVTGNSLWIGLEPAYSWACSARPG